MPASAHDVAAAIRRRLPGVGRLKLHKLLYYCQGHHLAHLGEPLFDEKIEAWEHGPVVAELWRDENYDTPPEEFTALDNGQLNTIGYIVSRYGNNSGRELETLTHQEQPWQVAYGRQSGDRDRHVIDRESMRTFFADVAAAEAADEEIQFDPADVARLLADAREREKLPSQPDTIEALLARVRG